MRIKINGVMFIDLTNFEHLEIEDCPECAKKDTKIRELEEELKILKETEISCMNCKKHGTCGKTEMETCFEKVKPIKMVCGCMNRH